MIPLNPLSKVTDYQSMLRRIFVFTTIAGCVAVWLLRRESSWINNTLSQLDIKVDLPFVKEVNWLGYVLPAIIFAIVAYSIRLHDLLSDALRVRYFFDTRYIIRPMALKVGVLEDQVPRLYSRRSELMKDVFYRYASSTKPVIDTHNIHEALDNWAWVWVLLEAWFVFMVCGIALCCLGSIKVGLCVLAIATGVVVMLSPIYLHRCVKYAKAQVDDILSDAERRKAVSSKLNAIQG